MMWDFLSLHNQWAIGKPFLGRSSVAAKSPRSVCASVSKMKWNGSSSPVTRGLRKVIKTQIFHAIASTHKHVNRIKSLHWWHLGCWQGQSQLLHYQLFPRSILRQPLGETAYHRLTLQDFSHTRCFPSRKTLFSEDEIKSVVWDLGEDQALGQEGTL